MSIVDRTQLDLENIALRVLSLVSAHAAQEKRAPVLAVTSARPREGKTYLATALALYTARLGHRVLAVDANADHPMLHQQLKCRATPGFFDGLAAAAPGSWTVQAGPLPDLDVLPAGDHPRRALLFKPDALARFTAEMGRRYGLIVIDAPTLDRGGAHIAGYADKSILVVDSSRTRREVIQGALAASGVDRARLLGAVLNKRPLYIPRLFYRFL